MRWRSILVVAVLAVAAGCTTTAETEPTPGGPCLNGPDIRVGDSSVTVVAGDEEISPALDFEALEYSPGHGYEGRLGSEADGFLYAIDESVVQAAPGSIITIRGAGYPKADLRAGLEIIDDRIDASHGRVWDLRAPAEVGRNQVDLYLDWDEGKAHYAFTVDAVDGR